jgi:hypothetical protein
MITPHLSSNRDDSALAAEVKTRRARAAGTGHETYGAENLPVLIRLPDLTTSAEPVVAMPVAASGDSIATLVDASRDSLQDSRPAPPPREWVPAEATDRQSNARANRRARREVPRATPARSTGGARQFLLAVVLAGVLFAIIVTIKEWNQAAPTTKPTAGREQVGAPALDFDQPELAPAANATFDQPDAPVDTVLQEKHTPYGVVPANGMTSPDTERPPARTTGTSMSAFPAPAAPPLPAQNISDEPIAPDAAGYADGAEQVMGSYGGYPSTGVEPVKPQSVSTGSAADGVWPPAVGNTPIRNADRNPADFRYQQR